jgi:hypothetical protein
MHRLQNHTASRPKGRMACSLRPLEPPTLAPATECLRQTSSLLARLPPLAGKTRYKGRGATIPTAVAQKLSPTTCSPRALGALHPHRVRPLWATMVEVAPLSTTPHMWVMGTSHAPICARRRQTSVHTARAHPTILPLHHPSILPPHPRPATKTAQVRINHNKTSLPSPPYPHQNILNQQAPLSLENKRTSSTMALLDRRQ